MEKKIKGCGVRVPWSFVALQICIFAVTASCAGIIVDTEKHSAVILSWLINQMILQENFQGNSPDNWLCCFLG